MAADGTGRCIVGIKELAGLTAVHTRAPRHKLLKPVSENQRSEFHSAGKCFTQRENRPFRPRRYYRLRGCETAMNDNDGELRSELARLQQEHRDLDAAIEALHHSPAPDLLRLQRLKKRKLQLRDRISFVEDQITPDIIA